MDAPTSRVTVQRKVCESGTQLCVVSWDGVRVASTVEDTEGGMVATGDGVGVDKTGDGVAIGVEIADIEVN